MAKRASKSPGSAAPPPSARARAPAAEASTATAGRMVLRVKSSEKMKRLAEISKESDEGRRTKLSKTSKGSHNKKKTNNKLDCKKPKKPPTAFFYFLEDFRKEFQEQNPDIKSMRDIGKACGAKWKTMTYDEKVQYYDMAAEKRREFDQAMATYAKKMESGEDLESEAETESDE